MGGPYLMGGMPGIYNRGGRLSLTTHDVAGAHGMDRDHLIRDGKEFVDRIPDIVPQTVGERIGLGTKEELGPWTRGYTTHAQMGVHATVKMKLYGGSPQGTVQGVQASGYHLS